MERGWSALSRRLRSRRAENTAGIIVIGLAVLGPTLAFAVGGNVIDWSVALLPVVTYVALVVTIAAGIVWLLQGSRFKWVRFLRGRARGQHWAIPGLLVALSVGFLPFGAAAFASTYTCQRGHGVLVQTSWTGKHEQRGVRTGVYVVDGETYGIVVGIDDYLDLQAGPQQGLNPDGYAIRTYRVPWVGSSQICDTEPDTERNELVGLVLLGSVVMTGSIASGLELVRRRRQPADELAG